MSSEAKPTHPWSLVTDRLIITRFDPTPPNAAFLVKLYNTPEFIAGEGDTGIDNPEKALRVLHRMHERFETYGHGVYLISLKPSLASLSSSAASTSELHPLNDSLGPVPVPIGSVSLMRGDYTCPDIGFALLSECTGQGYATEAARRMVQYATDPKPGGLGYDGVFGFTAPDNARSRRALERLGLKYRGVYPLQAFGGKDSAVFTTQAMGGLRQYGIQGSNNLEDNE